MLKILHVVNHLEVGGIQWWIAHLAKQALSDPDTEIHVLSMCVTPQSATLVSHLRDHGVHVHGPCPHDPVRLSIFLRRLNRQFGPFDVVHGNLYFGFGVFAWLCRFLGMPVRVSHMHSVIAKDFYPVHYWRRYFLWMFRYLIETGATHRWAVGTRPGRSFFGSQWPARERDAVMPISIPTPRACTPGELERLRNEVLGETAERTKILVHVGRLSPVKNQRFLLNVVRACLDHGLDLRLIIVGDGPERGILEHDINALDLRSHVVLLGQRLDATSILQLADAAILPSFVEACPLAAVEAKALGVPIVASTGVPEEPFAATSCFHERVSLTAPIEDWVSAVGRALASKSSDAGRFRREFERSPFCIENSYRQLRELYLAALAERSALRDVVRS